MRSIRTLIYHMTFKHTPSDKCANGFRPLTAGAQIEKNLTRGIDLRFLWHAPLYVRRGKKSTMAGESTFRLRRILSEDTSFSEEDLCSCSAPSLVAVTAAFRARLQSLLWPKALPPCNDRWTIES